MSNLTSARRRLFGAPAKRPRIAKPHDGFSKAQLWAELERLRAQLRGANRMATVAAHSIQLLGTEGTPAYRQLADAKQTLREVRALTEDVSRLSGAPPENSYNSTPSEPRETIGGRRASLPAGGKSGAR